MPTVPFSEVVISQLSADVAPVAITQPKFAAPLAHACTSAVTLNTCVPELPELIDAVAVLAASTPLVETPLDNEV